MAIARAITRTRTRSYVVLQNDRRQSPYIVGKTLDVAPQVRDLLRQERVRCF